MPSAKDASSSGAGIAPKERALLATQVINATLKALGDAVKNNTSQAPKAPTKPDPAKPRKGLRRSNSVPMTPLQPRSLNRVSTSPVKPSRSPNLFVASTGCLATIECTRAAFSSLRTLQASGSITLPELQLETGMSSFVNKLIGLNLFEPAAKELRILKRRLEVMATKQNNKKNNSNAAPDPNAAAKTLSDLLDFPPINAKGPLLGLIITAQLQALRVLHGLKRSAHLDTALPSLRQSNESSPLSLLLLSLQEEKPDRTKCASQLENLSKILLSLSPSIAAKDDATALEPRLSPSPETAMEIQALGFTARLQSWGISGHKGDVDKDILLPLSKCLAAFVRRASLKPAGAFHIVRDSFHQVWGHVEKLCVKPSTSSNAPLAMIYQVLGTTAREAGNDEAKKWTMKLKGLLDPNNDSVAKRFAVAAQLLLLALKQSPQDDEGLIVEVLESLQGPLSGQSAELDDLLISLCLVRKAAIHIVIGNGNKDSNPNLPSDTIANLEKLILQLPRFALRWLGSAPQPSGSTKEFLRFEQRRQLLSKYLHQILDSALMLINKLLGEERLAWDQTDSILMDTLALLENIGITFQAVKSDPSSSYYVKVSHFYYRQHLALRNTKATEPASLRALRRSIDAVKQRPENEQSRAQLFIKWERFAELCRTDGRRDDAADALRSIRDHVVRQEIIPTITGKLATEDVLGAWQRTPGAETLSRTVLSLAKLDRKPNDWTWLLEEGDKATALEHDLYFVIAADGSFRQEAKLSHPTIKTLLQIYTLEEYPVRRLRTLLKLLTINLDTGNETATLRTEAGAAVENLTAADLARDAGLAHYVPHLKSLAACLFILADGSIDTSSTGQALAGWKTIASSCHSAEELSKHVDDPSQLQTTLQSLADFARIRGLETLSADILEVSANISKLASAMSPDSLLIQSAALCARHLSLGQSAKVEKMLEQNKELISKPNLSTEAVTAYHLTAAEYHLAVGEFSEADHHLVEARNVATTRSEQRPRKPGGANRNISLAHASYLNSELSLERGDTPNALHFAKLAVKVLFHDWAKLEELRRASQDIAMGDVSQTETSGDESSLNNSQLVKSEAAAPNSPGPIFWAMVYPLFRCILRLSSMYAHVGMYQETLYYAEQAKKVAQSTESAAYKFQSDAWLALVWMMAGKPEKALEIAAELKTQVADLEPTCSVITMLCELSRVYRETEDAVSESELMDRVNAMVKAMSSNGLTIADAEPEHQLEKQMTKLSIKQTSTTRTATRQTRTTKTTKTTTAIASKRTVAKKPKATPVQPPPQAQAEDVQVSFLRASVLQCQSMDLLNQKDWTTAITNLHAAYELSKLSTDISQERMLMAMGLIGQSLDQMGDDSVFSVVPDSTLSFPSIAASLKERGEKTPSGKSSSPRKARGTVQDMHSFTENLRQAQEYLLEAHSVASVNGDGGLVHRIANLLQNVSILLSTTSSSRGTGAGHPAHATCSIELARNLIWRRERKTLRLESAKGAKPEWPMPMHPPGQENRRFSLGFSIDMNKFQRDYVDIIPRSWNVVSVSLSDTQQDLCITKLQAGHSPFAIRLPLERASSRDADNEVFSFRQGRAELREIVALANRTCHDARDMSRKEAKTAWWAEREELDRRLGDLATNIEQTWLGGFRGIFTQHHRRSELLAKFQRTFLNMLDSHLPSRRQVRGRRAAAAATATAPSAAKINLDPRILDLFIGLGDPTAPDADDLEEPLTDLLYFVVDILQFHGERNAYDEIDFDSMVVETYDALHAYHHAMSRGFGGGDGGDGSGDEGTHTILVLDNALHIFPWESLPCMQGRSVSRIPSLACLRRAILEQQAPPQQHKQQQRTPPASDSGSEDELGAASPSSGPRPRSRQPTDRPREGHYASIASGTYILNPSADLAHTAATFGRPLAANFSRRNNNKSSSGEDNRPGWTAIEGRAPSEDEFEAALRDSDILLYFGHGSGAQYVRARTLRRLDKCRAVALLMGCSSAALEDHFWDGVLGDGNDSDDGGDGDSESRSGSGIGGGSGNAFVPHGPVRNYMLAGSPAVVGTLWDVTDRDIDRFAARLFEEWGLLPRGTFFPAAAAKGKGKAKEKERSRSRKRTADSDDDSGHGDGHREKQTSLVEAVAKARDACRFRYLTAAAVCVYGIPVYISK